MVLREREGVAVPVRLRSLPHPGPMAVVVALLLVPLLVEDYGTFVATVGLVLAVACLGLTVLWGWARQISLMHAAVVGSATYLSLDYVRDRSIAARTEAFARARIEGRGGPDFAISYAHSYAQWQIAGAAVGIGFAVAVYLTVGLVARRLSLAYVVVLTFATQFAIEGYVFSNSDMTGGMDDGSDPRPTPFGVSLETETRYYYAVAFVALALVFALHRLRTSRYGRAIVFAGHDPRGAAAAGISPWRYRTVAFGVAGFCAGLSGVLQVGLYRAPPGTLQFVWFNSIFYLAVVVLAGSASLLATVAVAMALQVGPELLLAWELNVYVLGGVGMVVGLMLGPRGLGGAVIDRFARPPID